MKNVQASYNKDVNKVVEQAKQEKAGSENLIFSINLALTAILAEDKVTKEMKL